MDTIHLEDQAFVIYVDGCIARSERCQSMAAVFAIEFDNIIRHNHILQSYGESYVRTNIHQKILTLFTDEVRYTIPEPYRYLVAKEVTSLAEAESFASYIIHTFSEPCNLNGHLFFLSVSIGISLYPIENHDARGLMRSATHIMQKVRQDGHNLIGVPDTVSPSLSREYHTAIIKALPEALDRGEIDFYYQPQYSYNKKCYVGAELLCRWEHPELGNISPGTFIPIAEQSGMIAPLTVHTIITASKAFAKLRKEGIDPLFSLSVNISPIFLTSGEFIDTVDFLITHYMDESMPLHFEITEEVLIRHSDHLQKILLWLKERNIRIEIDDFGTGYTSLKHLAYLPFDTLKIDRSFIQKVTHSKQKQALVKAIIELSNALDIGVIAEGIEGEDEEMYIKQFKGILAQGYYYTTPLTLENMILFIKKNNM